MCVLADPDLHGNPEAGEEEEEEDEVQALGIVQPAPQPPPSPPPPNRIVLQEASTPGPLHQAPLAVPHRPSFETPKQLPQLVGMPGLGIAYSCS